MAAFFLGLSFRSNGVQIWRGIERNNGRFLWISRWSTFVDILEIIIKYDKFDNQTSSTFKGDAITDDRTLSRRTNTINLFRLFRYDILNKNQIVLSLHSIHIYVVSSNKTVNN